MNKGKIGILTFHCSNNYGAVLQAYALRQTLERLHPQNEVCVINYRCKGTITPTSFTDIKKKKGLIGALLHYKQINHMNEKFDLFRKNHLHLSKEYYKVEDLKRDMDEFDVVISGSDQVWNLRWSDGDTVYFQTFHDQNQKKYSYAASFGFQELDEDLISEYKAALQKFNAISVREKSGLDIIEKQLGLTGHHNIDPTLLLDKEDWSKLAKVPQLKGKYILVYMVPKQQSIIDRAISLRKITGLPIVMLSKNLRPANVIHRGESSPEEYVGWFKNAEFVVTNSFHGTAFSCIFQKNLWIDLNTERGFNTRSKSLLDLCGLEYRISDDGIAEVFKDDWLQSKDFLEREKARSEQFLTML